MQLQDPRHDESAQRKRVYIRFSNIYAVKFEGSDQKIEVFLAISLNEDGKPESLFVCPINKSNGDPFRIEIDQEDKESELNFDRNEQIQIHIIENAVLITSLTGDFGSKDRTAVITKLDFSEGIQKSKVTREIIPAKLIMSSSANNKTGVARAMRPPWLCIN